VFNHRWTVAILRHMWGLCCRRIWLNQSIWLNSTPKSYSHQARLTCSCLRWILHRCKGLCSTHHHIIIQCHLECSISLKATCLPVHQNQAVNWFSIIKTKWARIICKVSRRIKFKLLILLIIQTWKINKVSIETGHSTWFNNSHNSNR